MDSDELIHDLDEIRARLRDKALSPDQALPLVEKALARPPSASLWLLRGHLIQLSDNSPNELDDARKSYEEAARLEPDNPEPLEELGRFYDAVMADRGSARKYFLAALERGAGEACSSALAELDSEDS